MKNRTQSLVEYITLVTIAMIAISTMVFYTQRAMNNRFRQVREELFENTRSQ